MPRGTGGAIGVRLLLLAFLVATVAPFLLCVLSSLKGREDLGGNAFALPTVWHWGNYASAWTEGHFGDYFVNSVVVVVPVVGVSVLFSTLGGYAFAFLDFPAKRLMMAVMVLGLVVPEEAFIIPLYYELQWMHLANSTLALILPQIALSMPFGIIFMAGVFRELPRELTEAAIVDGASRSAVLWRVLVPVLRPAISTLALFLFIWTWNEFLLPLILVNADRLRTMPVGMLFFQGRYTLNVPVLTAAAVMTIAPLIVVYILFQRKFIEGMTAGAGK